MFDILASALAVIFLLSSIWTITIIRRFFGEARRLKSVNDVDFRKTRKRTLWGLAIVGLSGGITATMAAMSTPNNALNLFTAFFVVFLFTIIVTVGGVATLEISVHGLNKIIDDDNNEHR